MEPTTNLGQWPRRTFEDLRLQTEDSLKEHDSSYFFHYPSQTGDVVRQLHDQLIGFARQYPTVPLSVLIWGRAGDISHIYNFLSHYDIPVESFHGVVDTAEDLEWAEAHTEQDIWHEMSEEHYCAPPYVPKKSFNCILVMGKHRDRCLEEADQYKADGPYCLLVVDEDYTCNIEEGYHFLGGPVWRPYDFQRNTWYKA